MIDWLIHKCLKQYIPNVLDLVLDLSAGLVDKLPTPDEDVFKLSTTVNPKQLKLDTVIPIWLQAQFSRRRKIEIKVSSTLI